MIFFASLETLGRNLDELGHEGMIAHEDGGFEDTFGLFCITAGRFFTSLVGSMKFHTPLLF